MMRALGKPIFLLLLLFSFIFSAWYVLHQDIIFSSDIARDFLLLQEVDQKKFVLIGPRSSSGLFHGPLWLYVNYPAYFIGGGNPVVVGWYWVLLSIVFVGTSYSIAKKLFDQQTAVLYALMLSLYMGFHTGGLFNPHGAMFVMPAFLYTFVRYLQTRKPSFLVAHVLLCGLMIQFEMADGIPLTMLSFAAVAYYAIKTKLFRHLLFLSLIVLPLATFILFDLRHQFLLTHQVIDFISPKAGGHIYNYFSLIKDRLTILFTKQELLRDNSGLKWLVALLPFCFFLFVQVKDKKYRLIYYSFLYFYLGFFILSFINKGPILYFYLFPFFPLFFLVFSSFVTSRYKTVFLMIFFIFYVLNIRTALGDMQGAVNAAGNDIYSWKFLHSMAEDVFKGPEQSFGYFVYSPDVVAYNPQYAMEYTKMHTTKQAHRTKKEPVTYLIIAPPPPDKPMMKEDFWIKNQVHINEKPIKITTFPNGYKIEKFRLTKTDIAVPFDPNIDPGLHFR